MLAFDCVAQKNNESEFKFRASQHSADDLDLFEVDFENVILLVILNSFGSWRENFLENGEGRSVRGNSSGKINRWVEANSSHAQTSIAIAQQLLVAIAKSVAILLVVTQALSTPQIATPSLAHQISIAQSQLLSSHALLRIPRKSPRIACHRRLRLKLEDQWNEAAWGVLALRRHRTRPHRERCKDGKLARLRIHLLCSDRRSVGSSQCLQWRNSRRQANSSRLQHHQASAHSNARSTKSPLLFIVLTFSRPAGIYMGNERKVQERRRHSSRRHRRSRRDYSSSSRSR